MNFKYPPVVVVWSDAESDASWDEVPNVPLKPTIAVTLGFLVVDEKDYIMVADSYFQDPHSKTISNTTKIPRAMIVDLAKVNINEKKKKLAKEAKEPKGRGPDRDHLEGPLGDGELVGSGTNP